VVRRFQDLHASFTARFLILRRPDGTVEPYLALIRYQRAYRRRSRSWQDNAARALGLFWDFCVAHADQGWSARDLFRNFSYALLEGTLDSPCVATRSLMWPSISRERARGLVKSIEGFAEWCSTQDDIVSPIAPQETQMTPGTGEHAARLLAWSHLRRVSMLQHIKQAPTTFKRRLVDFGRSAGKKELQRAKHFPPKFAEKLLWEGHKRPGAATEPNIFLRYNVRDMMIALLDGWGGLRRSEGLHLWEKDVTEDKDRPGHALVVLNHPEEARVEWQDPLSGARRMISGAAVTRPVRRRRAQRARALERSVPCGRARRCQGSERDVRQVFVDLLEEIGNASMRTKMSKLHQACRRIVCEAKMRLSIPLVLRNYGVLFPDPAQAIAEQTIRNKRASGNP
jgi:hypothetical protein